MQKWFVSLLAAALLAGCGAPPAPTAAAKAPGRVLARSMFTGAGLFKRLDISADGRLSLAEFRQLGIFGVNGRLFDPAPHPPLPDAQEATFKSFDKDRDQLVSGAEFENFGVALQYALDFGSTAEFYTELFPTLDLDRDDRLTPAEWEQMGFFGAPFAGLDHDRDGYLTLAELARG